MAAPFEFLYPIIHGCKKAQCVPGIDRAAQAIDLKDL
jgi:hypothetical protein